MVWRILKKVFIFAFVAVIVWVVSKVDLGAFFNTTTGVGFLNRARTVLSIIALLLAFIELVATILDEIEMHRGND